MFFLLDVRAKRGIRRGVMDEQMESKDEPQPAKPSKPFIPPPDLSRSAPAPPSPLDVIPRTAPAPPQIPPTSGGEPVVHVRIREEGEAAGPPQGLAPFNTRFIAVMIDWIVVVGVGILLYLILPLFASRLTYLVGIGYLLTRDALPFLGGQSVGKKAMKIRAVTLDGQPLTGRWEPSVIRNIPLVVIAPVELYILLTREDRPDRGKRLGDEWAKTKVILEPQPVEGGEI